MRAFADVLADSPEEVLATTEACELAAIESTQLRGALGTFTQWMQATTEYQEWPCGWAFGEMVDPDNPTEHRKSKEQGPLDGRHEAAEVDGLAQPSCSRR